MWARCIPIYWGNERVGEEFNKNSMLCRNDYPDDESFIQRILEVDSNDELYRSILNEPYFINNEPNIYFNEDRLLNFSTIFWMMIKTSQSREKILAFRSMGDSNKMHV